MSPLSQTHPDFIPLPVQNEASHSVNQLSTIELRLCNGAALTFSSEVLTALLTTMIEEAKL